MSTVDINKNPISISITSSLCIKGSFKVQTSKDRLIIAILTKINKVDVTLSSIYNFLAKSTPK